MKHSITWEEQQKARRRLQKETGTILKDWGGKLPFAFVYPNDYFIGMSNLGLQALYGLINNRPDCLCERVFWDKENSRNGALPLSVESQRPLTDYAVAAFSLNYEIDFLNLAPIFKSSGIPLYSEERDESYPLIIAGGPCITANPLPVAPFFDCLCIGEAEAILPRLLPLVKGSISAKRSELLQAISEIPGVWVPRLGKNQPVKRQWLADLDSAPVGSVVLSRDTELGDLYLMETERGCAHNCRFCLVSCTFSPMRFRSIGSLLEQADNGLKYRKRLGLVGPAVTDHPEIETLLSGLLEKGAQFSISSLRITSLNQELLRMMVKGGLRSVALAPEAGSESLRQRIKKGISEAQILEAVQQAARAGMQQLKLYFMIGLPQEQDSDIEAIIDLTLRAKALIEQAGAKTRLTLNISPFVPKAGTVFQWLPMAGLGVLQERLSYIKNRLSRQGVKINHESPAWSEVQAVLSRGDEKLAAVLADISHESLPEWKATLDKHQVDVSYFAHQKWEVDKTLPWGFIDSGHDNEKVKAESSQISY
jgi:radical SAM superfamily enzyme YgiQ (UPF0313 family)